MSRSRRSSPAAGSYARRSRGRRPALAAVAGRGEIRPGQSRHARGDRGLGHRREARRQRASARARQRRRRPDDLRREMRELSRHVRREQQLSADRRRRGIARVRRADSHDRQQAQLRDDALRLHTARDAVQCAAIAHRGRGLCADRVRAQPQRHRRRRRRARPGLAAEAQDAESRRLHDRARLHDAATASRTPPTSPA